MRYRKAVLCTLLNCTSSHLSFKVIDAAHKRPTPFSHCTDSFIFFFPPLFWLLLPLVPFPFFLRVGERGIVAVTLSSPVGHESGLDHEHGLGHRLLVEVQAAVRSLIRAIAEDLPQLRT